MHFFEEQIYLEENYEKVLTEYFGENFNITNLDQKKCKCRWDLFCGSALVCKEGAQDCEETNFGCGWIGLQACKGRCDIDTPYPV